MAKMRLPPDVLKFFREQGARGGKLGGRKRWEDVSEEEKKKHVQRMAAKSVEARRKKAAAEKRAAR